MNLLFEFKNGSSAFDLHLICIRRNSPPPLKIWTKIAREDVNHDVIDNRDWSSETRRNRPISIFSEIISVWPEIFVSLKKHTKKDEIKDNWIKAKVVYAEYFFRNLLVGLLREKNFGVLDWGQERHGPIGDKDGVTSLTIGSVSFSRPNGYFEIGRVLLTRRTRRFHFLIRVDSKVVLKNLIRFNFYVIRNIFLKMAKIPEKLIADRFIF